ncbi:type VI secretion protein IcmF/TssM N-terminal domain-containing protein [Serratia sp. T13T92]|uniref:type VI secretion protein IcmF/TssM N-terminal domain-containing protein n=1 Tax=Serratia sp. T13T92 TaxID=3397496 RepID=UPI0039DF67E0
MFKKLFSFAGWLLLLCLILLCCFIAGVALNWKSSTIFIVWLCVLLVSLISWSFLLWVSLVVKEKKIHRYFQAFSLTRREQVLFKNWRAGAKTLRLLQRKNRAMPWYIMMGERCGKSSLLASAGLPMFASSMEDSSVVPTQTFRWWFFQNVCFLDLSSRFLSGKGSFDRTWLKLARWIVRLPTPAGVVIGISVSDLINSDINELQFKARQIRIQLEQLISRFKYQLPIYITINKCDKYPAFKQWAELLSRTQQQQALGYYWHSPPNIDSNDVTTLLPLFTTLKEGFDLARLSMTGTPMITDTQYELLEFPEKFDQLQAPLWRFITSLCEPDTYFTKAPLAGVWFTSSEEQAQNKRQRTSYFVQELLTRHFIAFSLSREVIWRQSKMRRIALTSLLLLGCVAALSYSAIKSAALMHHDTSVLAPPELVEVLLRNESRYVSPLIYWPFSLVLSEQYHQIEQQLVTKLSPRLLNMPQMVARYQQKFIVASAMTQRQMALDLAQTIITLQSMRDGETLEELKKRDSTISEWQLVSTEHTLSPQEILVLQRWMIQQPSGTEHIAALRRLLSTLLNHDPTLKWLLAPEISLQAVQLKDFWPQHIVRSSPSGNWTQEDSVRIKHEPWLLAPEASLPAVQLKDFWQQNTAATSLSGVWTREGDVRIKQWIAQFNRASHLKQPDPVLVRFIETLPAKRQDAWRQLLLGVSQALQNIKPHSQSQSQLIALSRGDSPAIRFAQRISDELEDIPTEEAQPWLSELRRFTRLQTMSSGAESLLKLQETDTRMRNVFTRWLHGPKKLMPDRPLNEQIHAWEMWRGSLSAASNEALSKASLSPELTRGMFTPESEVESSNPLITLFANYERLRQTLAPQRQQLGIDAVWALYKSDASMLLSHAVARSSCWLNTAWQSNVVWPMRKNIGMQDHASQRILAWQYISDFMQGPAKGLFIVTDHGPQTGEFNGQTLSVTPEFLNLVRHILAPDDILDRTDRQNTHNDDRLAELTEEIMQLRQQQIELENEQHNIDVVSEPVTVPEGTRIFPTGTRLTLLCKKKATVFNSMNFAEQMQFTWQPGQCNRVDLDVQFPDFSVQYRYDGASAWPDFLEKFKQGEVLLATQEFDKNAHMLAEQGIKHVLVRFKLSEQQTLQQSWRQWLENEHSIGELIQQQRGIEQSQRKQSRSVLLRKLSLLPDNAAICR